MKLRTSFFAAVIITAATILAIASLWGDSPTYDEVAHIGAGYSYLARQSMHLNPEHPPLAKDLAALPLIFLDLDQSVFDSKAWLDRYSVRREWGQWDFGHELMYKHGNDGETVKNAARIPMLLFFVWSAIIIFRWTRQRYGDTGGIIALILFAFSPTIMTHSRFVTTDVAATWGVLLTIYTFIRYLRGPTRKHLILVVLALGLAFLTKFNTILLIPLLGILAGVHGIVQPNQQWGARFKHGITWGLRSVVVIVLALLLVVWPIYAINNVGYPPEQQRQDTQEMLATWKSRAGVDAMVWMADKPVIRYFGHYLLGVVQASRRAAGGNTIFFLGEVVESGGKIYFPLVYFIKETLAWWVLACIAILAAIWQGRGMHWPRPLHWIHANFDEFAMVLWLAIYWTISINSSLNLGIRHIIPTLPFAMMLVAGQIARMIDEFRHFDPERLKTFSLIIALLLGWHVWESVHIYPSYLAYFNQAVGGPSQGHKYVTDSNLDWGQDLKRLGEFIHEKNIAKMDVDYFGWADREFYLYDHSNPIHGGTYKDKNDFLKNNRSNGWIAVSATFYKEATSPARDRQKNLSYAWLTNYEPITVIGHSIFVWHIIK